MVRLREAVGVARCRVTKLQIELRPVELQIELRPVELQIELRAAVWTTGRRGVRGLREARRPAAGLARWRAAGVRLAGE